MEQEEYTKEEINWSYIEFVDNQDVLDLIEKVIFHCIIHVVYVKAETYRSCTHFSIIRSMSQIIQLSNSIFCRNLEELLHC